MTTEATKWDEARFVAVWPQTARRLEAYLIRRGVTRAEAEDIAQEVAIRAVRRQIAFHDATDLLPWVRTVARRIRIDNARLAASQHEDAGATPTDVASTQSVEDEVIARLRMSEVASAIARLPARDRQALLQTIERDANVPPASLAVVRHRARAKLLSQSDGMRAVGGERTHGPPPNSRPRLAG